MELGRHNCPTCLHEEAVCHAAVARASQKRADEAKGTSEADRHRVASARLEAWMTAGPPGYCDWAKATSKEDRERMTTEVLQHDGVSPIVGLALYRDTEGSTGVPDVPLHLVLTPGSGAARREWEYGR